jgi:lysophospholipase L1-like esterase
MKFPHVSLLVSAILGWAASSVHAETIRIVAFGDSGVYGSGRSSSTGMSGGVPVSQAFPARIEQKLRARGWDVAVSNQGVSGDRASTALSRVDSAVPRGTHLTLVMLGGNDLRAGASFEEVGANMRKIGAAILGKGSRLMIIRTRQPPTSQPNPYLVLWAAGLWDTRGIPAPQYDSGDREHLNVAGNDVIAERAVPDIERVLRELGFKPKK